MHEKHPLVLSLEETLKKHIMSVEKVVFRADKRYIYIIFAMRSSQGHLDIPGSSVCVVLISLRWTFHIQRSRICSLWWLDATNECLYSSICRVWLVPQHNDYRIRDGNIFSCFGKSCVYKFYINLRCLSASYDITGAITSLCYAQLCRILVSNAKSWLV